VLGLRIHDQVQKYDSSPRPASTWAGTEPTTVRRKSWGRCSRRTIRNIGKSGSAQPAELAGCDRGSRRSLDGRGFIRYVTHCRRRDRSSTARSEWRRGLRPGRRGRRAIVSTVMPRASRAGRRAGGGAEPTVGCVRRLVAFWMRRSKELGPPWIGLSTQAKEVQRFQSLTNMGP